MPKHENHIDKLSKRDKKKFFSHETGSGKGDLPREYTVKGDNAYKSNSFWDNCEFERKRRGDV